MKNFLERLKAALGVNPPRLNIKITEAEIKSYNSQFFLVISVSIDNKNSIEINLSPTIKTNFMGNRIANEIIKDIAIHFNGHLVDPSTEYSISEPTIISASAKGVIKNLVYKTNLQSDIKLGYIDTKGNKYTCNYKYTDVKIDKKPKVGWIIQ